MLWRRAFPVSLLLSPGTGRSDKRATKMCTSCEALNNYCQLLPTHCMKQLCMTFFQVACIIKATRRQGDQISLTPWYFVKNKDNEDSISSRNDECKKQAVLIVRFGGKQQSCLWIPQWKAVWDAYDGRCSAGEGRGTRGEKLFKKKNKCHFRLKDNFKSI